jgi:hypothetical protein
VSPASATASIRSQTGSLNGLRLITIGIALVPVAALGLPSDIPQEARVLASILWVLCLVPAWHYLQLPERRRPPVPFLPLIGAVYLFYYPLHVALGQSSVNYLFRLEPAFDYDRPVQYALAGWVALLIGYYAGASLRLNSPFRHVRPMDLSTLRTWGKLLVWGGLFFDAVRQVVPIPVVLRGILYFTSMLSLLGIALLTILAVQKRLGRRERWALYTAIMLTALLRAGSGLVSNVVILALTIFLAIWAGGGRLGVRWLVIAALSVAAMIAMRSVAMEYRARSWFAETQLSLAGRAMLMGSLLVSKVEAQGPAATVEDGWTIVAGRSANLDLLADVVRQTGTTVPFWGGETYLSLVGFAVPRFIWPSKPTKTLGQDFGHRYGYLDSWDTWTSINLPFLVEFYANFGEAGVLIGMVIVGVLYRLLDNDLNRAGQPLQVTICSLVLLVPLLNIESDFSLVFGGLFMNGVALWGLLVALSQLPGRRPRRSWLAGEHGSLGGLAGGAR